MRALMLAAILAVAVPSTPMLMASNAAAEESCTGDNCPPPQSQGGHDCEREKKDQTVS